MSRDELPLGTQRSATVHDVLVTAVVEAPSLLTFIVPWTVASFQALGYVEYEILLSLIDTPSTPALLVCLTGLLLTVPWMLLTVKSAWAVCMAICTLCSTRPGLKSLLLMELKKKLDLHIPANRSALTKLVAAIAIWTVVSLPFTLLTARLLAENKACELMM